MKKRLWVASALMLLLSTPYLPGAAIGLAQSTGTSSEGRSTGSVWLGYNFSVGQTVSLEFTPMIGGVFGNTSGLAPGYRASLGWRRIELPRSPIRRSTGFVSVRSRSARARTPASSTSSAAC